MEKEVVMNNFHNWKLIKDISVKYKNRQKLNISQLAKLIGISKFHPRLYGVLTLLNEIGILRYVGTTTNSKIIQINHDRLENLLESSMIYREFADYVHNKKIIYADI